MLIKFGSIVVDGRGKLGGQVYSKNRGGNYVRNNAVPTNPQTTFQQQQRAQLTQLSQGWSALTPEQIRDWNNATAEFQRSNAFGDQKRLSGKNLYTSLNRELLVSGQSIISDAPSPGEINVPISVEANFVVNDEFLLTVELGDSSTSGFMVVVATPPVSNGTSYVKNRLRVVEVTPITGAITEIDIVSQYEERFGTISEGDKVFVGAYTINTIGQRSPQIVDSTVIQPNV